MVDGHIHIEQGDYTLEWIEQFVNRAVETGLEEIGLLEHCYRFREFVPMYAELCADGGYVNTWFQSRAGVHGMEEYLRLMEQVRKAEFPVRIRFGLEVCYFKGQEDFVKEQTKDLGLDFLLGSVHFVDHFAFDHTPELWNGRNVDEIYRRYYETSISLAKCGVFDGIGHPDTIKLFGHRASFPLTDYYERLAQALEESGMYADQNSGAARRHPQTASLGIDAEFLRILKKHQVPFVTSSDAHCPEDVGDKIKELEERIRNA